MEKDKENDSQAANATADTNNSSSRRLTRASTGKTTPSTPQAPPAKSTKKHAKPSAEPTEEGPVEEFEEGQPVYLLNNTKDSKEAKAAKLANVTSCLLHSSSIVLLQATVLRAETGARISNEAEPLHANELWVAVNAILKAGENAEINDILSLTSRKPMKIPVTLNDFSEPIRIRWPRSHVLANKRSLAAAAANADDDDGGD